MSDTASPGFGDEVFDRLLDEFEVARILGQTQGTLRQQRIQGRGIPFVKLGNRIRYRQSDVLAFLAGLPRYRSTRADPE